jgi:hypothetical protein
MLQGFDLCCILVARHQCRGKFEGLGNSAYHGTQVKF